MASPFSRWRSRQPKRVSQTANPTIAATATAKDTFIQLVEECRSAERDGVIVHGVYSGRLNSERKVLKARPLRLDHDLKSRRRRLHRAITAPDKCTTSCAERCAAPENKTPNPVRSKDVACVGSFRGSRYP